PAARSGAAIFGGASRRRDCDPGSAQHPRIRRESAAGASRHPARILERAARAKARRSRRAASRHRSRAMSGRVDAHHHVWRLDRGDYGWLNPTPPLAPIYRDFDLADLRPLLAAANIDATVLVQAAP